MPGPGQVLLEIGACGVCGSDVPRVFSKGTYTFPTIPGHELAGVVIETGPDADPGLNGTRAAVFPLIPCRRCAACEIGAFAQCEDYDYLGSRCDGGFAEYVVAPAWNLVRIPESVSIEEAALCEPAAVAAHALRQAGLDLGDTVAVFGAGPIGVLVAMWARVWGAGKVLLIDIDDRKLEFARTLGFGNLCNAREVQTAEWIEEQTGRGADVVVEASGSTVAFEQAMHCARTFGKVVLLGNPEGEMKLSQQGYWAILRKQLRLSGSWNSTYRELPHNEWRLVLDSMASGQLDVKPLITHRIGLDGLLDALTMMRDRSAFSNKILYVKSE